jgi:glycerophosphoryl diester phosphodiesterase
MALYGIQMSQKPLIIVRGGDVEKAPENTLPAFESAISRGADVAELDVHLTVDKEIIVHHFYNLGTTDNGEGLVSEYTLRKLKALDSGSWFDEHFKGEPKPTLSEVFDLCKGRIRFEVDLKDSSLLFLNKVINKIEKFDLVSDVELTTAHYPLIPQIKKINPKLRTGTFFYKSPDWMPVRLAQKHILDWSNLLKIDTLHLNLTLITIDFVEKLHEQGFIVCGSNLDLADQIKIGLNLSIDSFSTGHLGIALKLRDEFFKFSSL